MSTFPSVRNISSWGIKKLDQHLASPTMSSTAQLGLPVALKAAATSELLATRASQGVLGDTSGCYTAAKLLLFSRGLITRNWKEAIIWAKLIKSTISHQPLNPEWKPAVALLLWLPGLSTEEEYWVSWWTTSSFLHATRVQPQYQQRPNKFGRKSPEKNSLYSAHPELPLKSWAAVE